MAVIDLHDVRALRGFESDGEDPEQVARYFRHDFTVREFRALVKAANLPASEWPEDLLAAHAWLRKHPRSNGDA